MLSSYFFKIVNFGPITNGFDSKDGYFPISRLSVFIGEQGSGKSTVAKVISTFLWLEKAFVREIFNHKEFTAQDFIALCANQSISDYFTNKTELGFISSIFKFEYSAGKFSVIKKNDFKKYESNKIMYIPSERNLVSVIENADKISGLPYSLSETMEIFLKANKLLNESKRLPINGFAYSFDRAANTGYVLNEDSNSKVKLSKSSSGLQSFIPLFLITEHLSNNVANDFFDNLQDFSLHDKEKARALIYDSFPEWQKEKARAIVNKLDSFFHSGLAKEFSEDDRTIIMAQLSSVLNICFFNIVEEPEQNLFPSTQIAVVNMLIQSMNKNVRNSLIITTHSPFVLSAINNYLYAGRLSSAQAVVDKSLLIDSNFSCAYKLKDGAIQNIFDESEGLIDTEIIDECASLLNAQYDDLYNAECDNA